MKNYRAARNSQLFGDAVPSRDGQDFDDDSADDERSASRDSWQPLLIDSPGARLFRIAHPTGGAVEWQAEIATHGDVQSRRFSSELRARAWIAVQGKPCFTLSQLDLEELNQRFRASFLRRY